MHSQYGKIDINECIGDDSLIHEPQRKESLEGSPFRGVDIRAVYLPNRRYSSAARERPVSYFATAVL